MNETSPDEDFDLLLTDLNRCVGCFTCEVACEQEFGEKRIKVHDLGPYEYEETTIMISLPLTTDACSICGGTSDEDSPPPCVKACPTDALRIFKGKNGSKKLKEGKWQVSGLSSPE